MAKAKRLPREKYPVSGAKRPFLSPLGDISEPTAALSCLSLGRKQVSLRQDRVHRVEFEVVEKASESCRATIEVEVMPEARQRARLFDPRLLRIDLPGVDVEHELLLPGIQLAQRPAREAVGEQPEITAARNRNLRARVAQHRDRKFDELASARGGQHVRLGLGVGVASTAYAARDLDYNLVVVSDACTSPEEDNHRQFMQRVFPRMARVRTAE